VLARVPVRGRLALAAGAGGVWALQSNSSARSFGSYLPGPLLHVDPRTNRVRARIRLRVDRDDLLGLGVYVHGGRVWVWGPRDVLRIDPKRDRVAQRIRVPDIHGDVAGLALRGRRLVAALADGTYLWLDARSGRPLRAVRTPFPDPVIRGEVGSRLIVSSNGVLAALQPATGRVVWSRRLGFRAGAVARAFGLLWVHSAAFHEPGDRLSGLDPATGTVVTTSILPAFGMTGVVAIGRRLLAASAGGRLLVITPLML
jgi:sugar lactone lactonase YvrE